jgi:hypothetical protein
MRSGRITVSEAVSSYLPSGDRAALKSPFSGDLHAAFPPSAALCDVHRTAYYSFSQVCFMKLKRF